MDKVRLGRILGKGARQAARTAWDAIDAATAPDPNPPKPTANRPVAASVSQKPTVMPPSMRSAANPTQPNRDAVVTAVAKAVDAAQSLERGKRQMKQAALAPIKRAGHALWLEVTGSFFLIFAIGFGVNAWRVRTMHGRPTVAFFCIMCVLFLYFSATSFMKARRR
ncbi:MAG: hypothetical protein JSS87_08480 [Acidobacteria bacterium]|nr:hypothetical protein [Acidobacteriota bacterium]